MLVRTRQFGLEAIAVQKETNELIQIEELFTKIHELYHEEEKTFGWYMLDEINEPLKRTLNSYTDNICKLVFQRFGILIEIRNNNSGINMISFRTIGNNSIFSNAINDDFKLKPDDFGNKNKINEMNKRKAEILHQVGDIDLNKAKVSGVFSKFSHALYLDLFELIIIYGLDPKELVAIFMHEIGHVFTTYETSYRIKTSNHVIEEIFETLASENFNKDKFKYYLITLEENKIVSKDDFNYLMQEDNRYILTLKSALVLTGSNKTINSNKYDQTSSEQVADNFAYKLGYGKELITGLHKTYNGLNPNGTGNGIGKTIGYTIGGVFNAIVVWAMLVSILGAVFTPLILIVLIPLIKPMIYASLIITFVSADGSSDVDMTYDALKIRYKRIRNQYVETLKKANVSDFKEELLVINELDMIINDLTVSRDVYNFAKDILVTRHKIAYRSMFEQQLIENLSANSLHLNNANLQVLIKGDK